jgi:hypothetical protein
MTASSPQGIADSQDWDQLRREPNGIDEPSILGDEDVGEKDQRPPVLSMLAAAWADLATVLGVCTLALLSLVSVGYQTTVVAFPWAAALSLVWWGTATLVLVAVRRGSPGMLMAGVVFSKPVPLRKLPWVLAAALFLACTCGLPALLGARRSPLKAASGCSVQAAAGPEED